MQSIARAAARAGPYRGSARIALLATRAGCRSPTSAWSVDGREVVLLARACRWQERQSGAPCAWPAPSHRGARFERFLQRVAGRTQAHPPLRLLAPRMQHAPGRRTRHPRRTVAATRTDRVGSRDPASPVAHRDRALPALQQRPISRRRGGPTQSSPARSAGTAVTIMSPNPWRSNRAARPFAPALVPGAGNGTCECGARRPSEVPMVSATVGAHRRASLAPLAPCHSIDFRQCDLTIPIVTARGAVQSTRFIRRNDTSHIVSRLP